MVMVLIYSPISSPRLSYAAKQLFGLIAGAGYEFTADLPAFLAAQGAKINYSHQTINGAISIVPHSLLAETNIANTLPNIGDWEGTPTLFAQPATAIPFDIFSAVFYLLSRYEEYTDTGRDEHGRYTAQQSLAHRHQFLHLPVINIWANKLRLLLNREFGLAIAALEHRYISTIDIDHVFYYKYKPLIRTILGGAKQLVKGEFSNLAVRIKATFGISKDPNDVYDWLEKTHKNTNTKAIFFFLVGDENPPYDPPPLYHKKEVTEIIKQIAKNNLVGIHPSYHSLNNPTLVLEEKQRLEKLTGQTIAHSRQHFLRFRLPETYRVLASCGIDNEYSMGYADYAGYRAGIAAPFAWFDLEKNEETILTIHPFAAMDVTLKNYMQLTPEKAIETLKKLYQPVQENGGVFMSLWHNEALSEQNEWKNWQKVYQLLLTFNAVNEN